MASSLVLDGLEVELCLSVGHELGEREVVLLEVRPLLLQVRQLHVRLVVGQLLLQRGVLIFTVGEAVRSTFPLGNDNNNKGGRDSQRF